jgi:hypothetical protein
MPRYKIFDLDFLPLLMNINDEICIEACRTIANMTNDFVDLEIFIENQSNLNIILVPAILCILLTHSNENIQYYAAGIIINITATDKHGIINILLENNAIEGFQRS